MKLLNANGAAYNYSFSGKTLELPSNSRGDRVPTFNRIAYSAAHVVADPRAANNPWIDCAIDWDATIAYREYLWSLGLGIAESMDTAQRGMGLDWPTSLELIKRSVRAAGSDKNKLIACGCGTDQLAGDQVHSLQDVINAYAEQVSAIEAVGGRLILMASRALAKIARGADDYLHVYGTILRQVRQPVVLHWLGDMFDPALAGYWGSNDADKAMQTALQVIHQNAAKIDGIKISLLNKDKEIHMRRQLPLIGGPDGQGVRMYTGDDFNYAELIAGDGFNQHKTQSQSDALLGIFDAIAPAASASLTSLAQNDVKRFHQILEPTVALSRHIFAAPTRFYKTGVVFMAWLNGHQQHFTMIGGQQSTRSLSHLSELFVLADKAGVLQKPDLALQRVQAYMNLHGVN